MISAKEMAERASAVEKSRAEDELDNVEALMMDQADQGNRSLSLLPEDDISDLAKEMLTLMGYEVQSEVEHGAHGEEEYTRISW